ncbi:MauE/DoxX family redox-associated membrane protein [Actinomadura gamaensis]|uniref:MauE/DoxX family redox-associated membrane protein n=1 Tax=Actinomadura gamaensis TaxID=1763541 RepID=A0ABV9TZN8_9ACTN
MVTLVQNVQVLLLAGVLLAACLAKLAVRDPVSADSRARDRFRVHGVPVAERPTRALILLRDRRAGIVLGLVEGTLGLALLLSSHLWLRVVAAVGFAGATWAVLELQAHRPEAGCGCFGGLSTKRVGRRSVVRATLFTAAAVVSLGASRAGVEVPRLGWGRVAGVLSLELALFASLSPELALLCQRARQHARALHRVPGHERYHHNHELADGHQHGHAHDLTHGPEDAYAHGLRRENEHARAQGHEHEPPQNQAHGLSPEVGQAQAREREPEPASEREHSLGHEQKHRPEHRLGLDHADDPAQEQWRQHERGLGLGRVGGAFGLLARRDVPCERRRSPIAETLGTLYASSAWLEFENALVSAVPLDVWREGCHRFLVYAARLDGVDVEIVFAVSTAARGREVRHAVLPVDGREDSLRLSSGIARQP